jgi:hypothetical protein
MAQVENPANLDRWELGAPEADQVAAALAAAWV